MGAHDVDISGNIYANYLKSDLFTVPSGLYSLQFPHRSTSNADSFGAMSFLAQQLQNAEDNGERAWIIMHQDSGWDGTNALP